MMKNRLYLCSMSSTVTSFVYGEVLSVSSESDTMSIKTKANSIAGSSFITTLPLHAVGCSTATAAEAASGIGTWMRRHAFCELNGTWLQGQVVAFDAAQSTVNLATPLATVTVPVGKLVATFPVCVALLASVPFVTTNSDSSSSIVASEDDMLRIHDTILNRLLTTRESGFPSRNFATILSGLIPTEYVPAADAVMSFIDEHSGVRMLSTIQHVVDFVFFVEGEAPNPTLIPCGNTFCNDPSQAATPMPPLQQSATGAVVQLQRVALPLRGPDDIFADADMASFLQQHIPPPPSPLAAPHRSEAAVAMAASRARGRPLESVQVNDIVEAFLRAKQSAKSSFLPNPHQEAVHLRITSPALAHIAPADFFSRVMDAAPHGFRTHPGTLIHLYDFSFGYGQLSLDHFRSIGHDEEINWARDAAGGRSFANTVAPPNPSTLKSIQCILDALEVLGNFFDTTGFGSQLAHDYLRAARQFVSQLKTQRLIDDGNTVFMVNWLNQQFHSFRHAILQNALHSSSPPAHLLHKSEFDLKGLAFALFLGRLNKTTKSAAAPQNKQQPSQAHGTRDHKHKHDKAKTRMPDNVRAVIPQQKGIDLCIRFLSNKDCTAGGLGTLCGKPPHQRIHGIPSQLPDILTAYMSSALDGLKSEYRHLA
ncbi:hypothetical protein AC1031_002280 [Aphanomyces cochlioides]|nr:hypothetical protein AC1031_002280 [Aphanomyces cochlioides]